MSIALLYLCDFMKATNKKIKIKKSLNREKLLPNENSILNGHADI